MEYPKSTNYSTIESIIFNHYKDYRLAIEDSTDWQEVFGIRLNEVMPYCNKMYDSASLEFEIFENLDYSVAKNKTHEGSDSRTISNTDSTSTTNNLTSTQGQTTKDIIATTINKTGETGSTVSTADAGSGHDDSTNIDLRIKNNTPQGQITAIDDGYMSELNKDSITVDSNNSYLKSINSTEEGTSANTETQNVQNDGTLDSETVNVGTGTLTSTKTKNDAGSNSSTDTNSTVTKGKSGNATYQQMLQEYRNTILNVNNIVLRNLADLFICCF